METSFRTTPGYKVHGPKEEQFPKPSAIALNGNKESLPKDKARSHMKYNEQGFLPEERTETATWANQEFTPLSSQYLPSKILLLLWSSDSSSFLFLSFLNVNFYCEYPVPAPAMYNHTSFYYILQIVFSFSFTNWRQDPLPAKRSWPTKSSDNG